MRHSATAALAAALLGCAQATPPPAVPPAADGPATDSVELSGFLSRKGPAETSYWAVTDRAGKVHVIVDVTPDLEARLRSLQNAQVTLRVERKGGVPFEQVRVREVLRPAP
jgi:hypothetical protein